MTVKKSDRNQDIAVKVRVARPKRSTPIVHPAIKAAPVAKPLAKAARPKIHELPLDQRKRIMWWMVGSGMFVIMIGWSFALGHELRQPDQETGLIGRITNVFRTFKLPSRQEKSPAEEEIRQLEGEVFPQFKQ